MFNEDRDRQMSSPPEKPQEVAPSKPPPTPEPTGKKYKSRIDSWLKGAEEDAEIAKSKRDFELKKAAYDVEVHTKVRK